MVGDDAVRRGRFAAMRRLGAFFTGTDQRHEGVRVVIVMNALQNGGDAFEPHAGIDAGARQIKPRRAIDLFILHENQVPDFNKTVAVFIGAARRPAKDMIAVIVENFRTWPARARIAHRPEIIVGCDANNPAFGKAGDLFPQRRGFVIGVINGDGQFFRIKPPFAGQQAPGVFDGVGLEIIAKAEITQHFKEGMMACGIADIIQIIMLAAGAHAFLRRCRRHIGPGFKPGKDVLERHHASVHEHQRRIILRHQRR